MNDGHQEALFSGVKECCDNLERQYCRHILECSVCEASTEQREAVCMHLIDSTVGEADVQDYVSKETVHPPADMAHTLATASRLMYKDTSTASQPNTVTSPK